MRYLFFNILLLLNITFGLASNKPAAFNESYYASFREILNSELLFKTGFAPATYYISNDGSTGNTGLSSVSPWNMTKLLTEWYAIDAGSTILFKRGSRFIGTMKTFDNKANITFDAYGTGNIPEIYATVAVSTWTNEGGNKWSKTDASFPDQTTKMVLPAGVFINGKFCENSRYPTDSSFFEMTGKTYNTLVDNTQNWTTNEFANSVVGVRDASFLFNTDIITSNNSNTLTLAGAENLGQAGTAYIIRNSVRGLVSNGDWIIVGNKLTVYFDGNLNEQSVELSSDTTAVHFDNMDNFSVNNISFGRANLNGVIFTNCDGLTLNSITIRDCGNYLGFIFQCSDIEVTKSVFTEGLSNGLVIREYSNGLNVNGNYFNKIFYRPAHSNYKGNPFGGSALTPTHNYDENSITYVDYNVCDSSYIFCQPHWHEGDFYGRYNVVVNYGNWLGDAAGFYCNGMTFSSNKYFKHNIILHAAPTNYQYYNSTEEMYSHAFYLDEDNRYCYIDSNVVIGTNLFVKLNVNNKNNYITNNIAFDACRDMNHNNNWQMIITDNQDFRLSRYTQAEINADPTLLLNENTNFSGNILILGPSSSGNAQRFNMWHGTVMSEWHSDYNKFVMPFTTNSSNVFRRITDYYSSVNDYTLNSLRSTYGLETNSTMNPQVVQYSSGLGISENDFVKIFVNASDTTHIFSLGNCTFKNMFGANVSGSIAVSKFWAQVLFYQSGDISTIDSPIYSSYGTFSEPTTPVNPLPVGKSLIKVGNTYKYIKVPGHGKLLLGIKNTNALTVKPKSNTPDPDPDPDPIDTADFNIYMSNTFENRSVGNYTYAMQQEDFNNGLYEWGMGHRTDITDPISCEVVLDGSNKVFRVNHAINQYGAASGTSFEGILPNSYQEALLSYRYRTKSGFLPVQGGKMIGLMGGLVVIPFPPGVGGGFNAGAMWNEVNAVQNYNYHAAQSGEYGEGGDWNLNGGSYLEPGVWHTVTVRVVMNTIGLSNGIYEAFIDGRLVYQSDHFKWRTGTDVAIERLMFVCFFGGGDSSWAADRDEYTDFDNLTVWSYKAGVTGVTRGLNLSNPSATLVTPLD